MSRRDIGCAVLLCGVGGWVDAVSYLRFGAFSGAMSGNTVLLGISIMLRSRYEVLYFLCVVGAFVAAIVSIRLALSHGASQPLLLLLSAALLAAGGFVANHWAVVVLAVALGTQNAALRKFSNVTLNTVFITGNLEQLAEAVPQLPSKREHVIMIAIAWASYAAGAAGGGAAEHLAGGQHLTHAALAPPLVLSAPAVVSLGAALWRAWPARV